MRGYYVEIIGNITDEAVQKYIKEQAEESGKKIPEVPLYSKKVKALAILSFEASSENVPLRTHIKQSVELVVDDLGIWYERIIHKKV